MYDFKICQKIYYTLNNVSYLSNRQKSVGNHWKYLKNVICIINYLICINYANF